MATRGCAGAGAPTGHPRARRVGGHPPAVSMRGWESAHGDEWWGDSHCPPRTRGDPAEPMRTEPIPCTEPWGLLSPARITGVCVWGGGVTKFAELHLDRGGGHTRGHNAAVTAGVRDGWPEGTGRAPPAAAQMLPRGAPLFWGPPGGSGANAPPGTGGRDAGPLGAAAPHLPPPTPAAALPGPRLNN